VLGVDGGKAEVGRGPIDSRLGWTLGRGPCGVGPGAGKTGGMGDSGMGDSGMGGTGGAGR
jgi:hypothetical protein